MIMPKKRLSISNIRSKKSENESTEVILPELEDNQADSDTKLVKEIPKSANQGDGNIDNPRVKTETQDDLKSLKHNPTGFISNHNEESEPSLLEYLEVGYRNKWLILIITLLCIIGAYVLHIRKVPLFRTRTKIFIHDDSMELEVINNKPFIKGKMDVATWMEILKTRDVCKRVSAYMNNTISPQEAKLMINCTSSKNEENIISITSTNPNPVIATDVANNFYRALRDYDTEANKRNINKTIDYLEHQLRDKNHELDSLNTAVKALYANIDFKNYGDNLHENLKRLNAFKHNLTTVEVELEAENANIKVLNSKLKEEDSTYITETTYSEPLKIKLMNLEVDLARALTTYGENHPKVISLRTNIANIKKLISDGVEESIQMRSIGQNPLKQQILKDLVESQTRSISLTQKRNALRKVIKEMELSPKDNSMLVNKQREKDALILTITNLQNQINKVRLNANIDFNRIVQLEEATIPQKPIGKNLLLMLLNGLGLGVALSSILVFLLTRFDNKINTINKLLHVYPNIPIIGTIPRFKFSPIKIDAQTSNLTEEELQNKDLVNSVFNEIALNFRYLILNKRNNAIAVVSSLKGEGKSTITNYLAVALANNNTKTLLVDADFYNPQISRYYSKTKAFGFSEVLSEQIPLHEVIINTKIDNLMILPSGKCPPSVGHLYHSDRFKEIIQEVKSVCDIIIIDTPASMYFPETSVLVNEMDCVLLTAKMGFTTTISCKKLLKKIQILDTKIGGVIANSMLKEVFDKTYSDYYNYSYEYYSRYHNYTNNQKQNSLTKHIPTDLFKVVKKKDKLERTFLQEGEILDYEAQSETNFGRINKDKTFGLFLKKLKRFLGLDDDFDLGE